MIRPEARSWSGVRDGFGERATAVDEGGRSVDLLRLFATFTPASQALADRIALLGVDRPAVGRAIALERDEPTSRLILISEHVPGVRLSELLQTAVERSVVADLGAALFVMRRLLTLAESLKASTRITQFSIAPERIVITPHGRVVIAEPVLAAAAEAVAIGSNDIAGIAVAGMSIVLGHLIEDAEHIDPLSPVLQDATDVAAIRAGSGFATALRLWFDRAIIADPTLSFSDFRQARLALANVGLERESGCDASRRALKVFLSDLAIERLADVEAAALEVDRVREMRAKRLARWKAISAPDAEWISVEDEFLSGDESRGAPEEIQGTVVDLSDERADEAIEIGSLDGPEMAAQAEGPIEAAPVQEPIEAAPVQEPIEAAPAQEPIEAVPAEEPIETAPVQEPIEADLVQEPIETAPVQEPIEAAPVQEPIEAAPVQEPIEAAPVQEPIEAAPVQEPIEAAPVQEPIEAAPVQEPIEAAPVQEPIEAAPVQEPIEAAPVQEPIEAVPAEEPIEAALAEEPIETVPAPSPRSWFRSMTWQLGQASAEPQPRHTAIAAPAADVPLESRLAEQSHETIPESIAAETWVAPIEPVLEEARPESDDAGHEGLAEAGEEPIDGADEELPVETIEESLTEEAEPVAADRLDQSPPMVEPAIERREGRPADVAQDLTRSSADEFESAPIDAHAAEEPETLERPAENRPETAAAESSRGWTGPVWEESFAASAGGEERLAEAREDEPIEVAEPVLPVETIAAPIEDDEPAAPADGSAAAELSEDAHRSWIRSITEQLGRMRRREEGLPEPPPDATAAATDATRLVESMETESPGESRETVEEIETLFGEDLADTPPVEAAPIRIERAAIPHVEERADQPAARAAAEPAPWRDDASAAGRAMPFPAGFLDRESRTANSSAVSPPLYAPHKGVVHERAADAQPHRRDVQPATRAPSPRTLVVPPREWKRAAATALVAGLALVIVAALVIAGRSYYGSVTRPGTIVVDSTPRGSEVLVDGAARGVTPLTLSLKPGDYMLELRRNGIARRFPVAVTPGAQLSQQLDWSTVRSTGTLAISSTPSQAKVTVDGKERGVTPLTVSDVPVGMRRVVIESSAGTVRRDVRVVADSQVTINETIIAGWIAAFAPFELQIYEGAHLLGTTDDGRIMLRPGRHELDFVNARLGFRERRGIEVNPGTTTAVNIATVVGIVRITAPAGADVLIDGVLFGDTPLRELRLPIGTHDIVLRHPQLGEQRVSVTVGASAPTEVNIDFVKR